MIVVFMNDPVILEQFFLTAENEISYVLCAVHVIELTLFGVC